MLKRPCAVPIFKPQITKTCIFLYFLGKLVQWPPFFFFIFFFFFFDFKNKKSISVTTYCKNLNEKNKWEVFLFVVPERVQVETMKSLFLNAVCMCWIIFTVLYIMNWALETTMNSLYNKTLICTFFSASLQLLVNSLAQMDTSWQWEG